MADLALAISYS